jgi:hypothetical protein
MAVTSPRCTKSAKESRIKTYDYSSVPSFRARETDQHMKNSCRCDTKKKWFHFMRLDRNLKVM